MAEEKTVDNSIDNPGQVDDKQSTKTFTQSDFDQMIAREKKRMETTYAGFDDMKKQNETLINEKKEKELADKTEIEKAQIETKEITAKLDTLTSEYAKAKQVNLRNDILSDAKFNKMPKAYRNLVELSDDTDIVQKSAEDALQEYEKDITGKEKPTFGAPLADKTSNGNAPPGTSMGEQIKQRMLNRQSNNTIFK